MIKSNIVDGIEYRLIRGFYPIPPEDAAAFAKGRIVLLDDAGWAHKFPDEVKE
jgi:hypothetical protein